jgi:predicted RNA polymerase sigma factor
MPFKAVRCLSHRVEGAWIVSALITNLRALGTREAHMLRRFRCAAVVALAACWPALRPPLDPESWWPGHRTR